MYHILQLKQSNDEKEEEGLTGHFDTFFGKRRVAEA
jgi:hypothetical protein